MPALTQWSSGSSSQAAPAPSSPTAGRKSLGEKAEDISYGGTTGRPAPGAVSCSRNSSSKSPYRCKAQLECKGNEPRSKGAVGEEPESGKGKQLHVQPLKPHCWLLWVTPVIIQQTLPLALSFQSWMSLWPAGHSHCPSCRDRAHDGSGRTESSMGSPCPQAASPRNAPMVPSG